MVIRKLSITVLLMGLAASPLRALDFSTSTVDSTGGDTGRYIIPRAHLI